METSVKSPDLVEGIEKLLDEALQNSSGDCAEIESQSFIVKLWIDDCAEEVSRARWHGHITHVPSGDRSYIEDLDGITAFISPYLKTIGVRRGLWRRVKRMLGRH
jgi:hypothetical protein